MKATCARTAGARLAFGEETAVDLMTRDPLSIGVNMTIREAAAFLTAFDISAATVVDPLGRPVGVLSRTDIVRHDCEKVEGVQELEEDSVWAGLVSEGGEKLPAGFHVATEDETPVGDLMTPLIYTVCLDTPADQVIDIMLLRDVHRLFVVDDGGALVGVISALDLLRHLRR